MEVKNPVTASVRTTVRTGIELFTIAFAIILPLSITAYATMNTNIPLLEIFTFGAVGTMIWWHLCWFTFWFMIWISCERRNTITEDTEVLYEINKLKSNLEQLEEIVSKANTIKEKKISLLKKAKEDKLISKDEVKQFSSDIENFDKISNDKALIKRAKAKLIKLELEMALSEYTSLQEEYTRTHSEIEKQINN